MHFSLFSLFSLGALGALGGEILHIAGFLLPSLIALADGRVVLTKRPTLCVQPHLKSVSHPCAALMRSFPPHHRANTRYVGHFIKMTLPLNTNSSPRSPCDLRGESFEMKNHSSSEPAAHSTLLSHFCARTFSKRYKAPPVSPAPCRLTPAVWTARKERGEEVRRHRFSRDAYLAIVSG